MNEKTLHKLEYDKIMAMLSDECETPLGKEKASKLLPAKDLAGAERRQKETDEGRSLLMLNPTFRLGGVRDIREAVELTTKGGVLDGERFLAVMANCGASRRVKLSLTKEKGDIPTIKRLAEGIHFINSLETAIADSIDDVGEVKDSATRELHGIRNKIRTLNDRVKDKLDNLIRNPANAKYLQDVIVTIRNDRYVVPVKQEYRNQIPGLVHDQSASGATLFIEPMSVLELNNDLKQLRMEENEEVQRILRRLSLLVAENRKELLDNLYALGEIDFILGKGRLSLDWNGFGPRLNKEGRIILKGAKHPLLGSRAVPIDFIMDNNLNGVIVTGPNTGGKTVSLKIVGLCVLLAQAGLHLPTGDQCEIGVFRGVYVDIGDEQSIEQSLSTFSSHMVNIVEILKEAKGNSLVLLDELGAGTDPVEGAALAMAIIDTLISNGVKVFVTTHYAELKAYAFNNSRLENASVEFDIDTLKPTYRLLMGVPGRSNAFDIALSLGISTDVIMKADDYMSQEAKDVSDFLTNLEAGRVETEKAKTAAQELQMRLEVMERDMKEREETLKLRESQIIAKAQERADKIVHERRKEADRLVKELKDMVSSEDVRVKEQAMRSAREKAKRMEALSREEQEPQFVGEPLTSVVEGDTVYVPRLKQNATVVKVLNSREVQIQSGVMKVNMKIKELCKPKGAVKDEAAVHHAYIASVKAKEAKTELDLRGYSAEEAILELEKFLDDSLLANLKSVRIIHGVGTGVLKKEVTEFMKRDKRVLESRLGGYYEGGAGVTIATLNV